MIEAVLILNDIRSAHNVGSIFRTADASGVGKIYLCGYTPAPLDRFGRPNKEIAKTALGAENCVAWEVIEDIVALVKQLKAGGFQIVALEQADSALDYKELRLGEKVAIVLGNEVDGVSPEVLRLCDVVAEIPMRGRKESLNVAVATGVALFRWLG